MNQMQIIEFYNQRLLTTEQLAEFYEATPKNIRDNFQNNRNKFIEGKHYFRLEGDDLKAFKNDTENIGIVGSRVNQLILYTKQGASRHSKMLGTDRAWDMFDELEENYFNPKQQIKIPTTPRELIQLALAGNEETNQRVDEIEERLVDIEENKLITTEDKGTIDRAVRKKVYQICKEQHLGQNAKGMLYQDLGSSIKQLFNVPNRGRIKDKDFRKALNFINSWEPSSVTKERINQIQTELEM
ncbi:ORF6N domain-containing protein [Enterococcus mundtii]|uniref:ORF6N domain-containing protein n=1 Tax=Enterococcus mundtii TaxID=53346 RepID=UPI001CCB664C|nr:ORF6N domain-containing protein [Enterococcus mundtii]UBM05173.1 ORF6C domain-containing protein [Enterococcus mundtii]GKS56335.1 phage anti-repressor protein [Enterococcus mundtii]